MLNNSSTVPPDPNCKAVPLHMKVLNRTDSSMVLNYNELSSRKNLCVQNKSEGALNNTCFPIGRSNVPFTSLDAATNYNFSVFSYVNTLEHEQLLSDSSCSWSNYTCKYMILSR